jgi:DNA polymerase-3 subunit gamma/tau
MDIDRAWAQIHEIIKRKRNQTAGLLNSCRRLAIKDGALVLGFATEVVRSKMETPENINITRAAIHEVLGITIDIVCIVAGKAGNLPANLDIDRDGMIGTALNMGGRIIDKE